MIDSPDYWRYLRWMLVATVLWLAAAAVVNLAIDPYGLFGSPRLAGVNAVKPAAPNRIRYAKPYYADRVMARTIIAGNSRPEAGIDPLSRCWPKSWTPVFNAGVPGVGLAGQIRYAEHASAGGIVNHVLMGLDLLDFLAGGAVSPARDTQPDCNSEVNFRFCSNGNVNPNYLCRGLRDRAAGLFSLTTFADSLRTVAAQGKRDQPNRTALGFNPGEDYVGIVRTEGQAVLFRQKNQEVYGYFRRAVMRWSDGAPPWDDHLAILAAYLERAKAQGINVILFTNPYHLDYFVAIETAGAWPLFAEWRRRLAVFATEHQVPLWDFHAIDERTTELPPDNANRQQILRWFWEPAHYRVEYGEGMLETMLGRDCMKGADDLGAPFGQRITPALVEARSARLRTDLLLALAANPQDRGSGITD